jgi:hypothetical protein
MTNLTWTEEITQITNVTTYKQFTTTSYGRQNLSIIAATPIGNAEPLPINIDGFKAMWALLFGSNSSSSSETSVIASTISDDAVMTDSFMYELGWYLRLYEDQFHDDHQSPLNILRNFITVPLQFYTTAMQAWNATKAAYGLTSLDGGVAMPDEMHTTVSAAHGEWRWKAPLGVVISWIAVAMILVLSTGAILLWVLVLDPPDFEASGSPPFDILSVSGLGCEIEDDRITLATFASDRPSGGMISTFRGKRVISSKLHAGRTESIMLYSSLIQTSAKRRAGRISRRLAPARLDSG